MNERDQLEQALAVQEKLRGSVPDTVIDSAIRAIQARLEALDSDPKPTKQRRQVTILFADIAGFTAISETMDAEDVALVMDTYFQVVTPSIRHYGGTIEKFIGDAIMAVFGLSQTDESDPEQAVRAALAMQRAVADLNAVKQAAWGVELQVKIGINTGPVISNYVAREKERDLIVVGDTVNTAARLEQAAPAGAVLISHDTYRHIRGVFDVEPRPLLAVRGKKEPLRVYLVLRAKRRAFRMRIRGIEGVETKMIGREQEMARLQALFTTAVSQGRTTAVTIVGEAGLGKSRLLDEFEQWLELHPRRIRYFKARPTLRTQGIPYFLFRDMLAGRFQIWDSDPLTTVRQKFVDGVARFLPEQSEMKAHILGGWLGFNFNESPHLQLIRDDPEQVKNQATLYLAQLFAAIGADQPTVIFLEDIHWADSRSLETLVDLARRQPALPLLIVGLARPSLYERQPAWGARLPDHTRLDLSPLSTAETQALVTELLRLVRPLPQLLVELTSNRAEGNPFYAEEIIKMLLDNGVIVVRPDMWQVIPDQLLTLQVPSTLTGVLQARLDKLQPHEKETLKQASVIGRIFWDKALARLSDDSLLALPVLTRKELIIPQPDSEFAGMMAYSFKHAILRDVTYETVLKSQRRRYHGLVADWLAMTAEANDRGDEYAVLIGGHYRLAENVASAAVWYGRAGQQALANHAHEDAERYLTQALNFTPEDDVARCFTLLMAREKAYDMRGERPAQAADLDRLAVLARQLGPVEQAQVALRQTNYMEVTSQYQQAEQCAQKAIEWGDQAAASSLVAAGYWLWGAVLSRQGQYAAARTKYQTGRQYAQAAADAQQEAACINGLGNIARNQGEFAAARQYYEEALTIQQEIGHHRGVSVSLNNLGIVAYFEGDYDAAQRYYEQALHIRREIGYRRGEGASLNNLGNIAGIVEELTLALTYYGQALAIQQEIGDRKSESLSLINLGNITKTQGDDVLAEAYNQQALQICREIGDRWGEAICLQALGTVARARGEYAAARQYYDQALVITRELGEPNYEGIVLNNLGALLATQAKWEQAEAQYQKALAIRQTLNQQHYLVEDYAGLARVRLAHEDLDGAKKYVQQVVVYLSENPHLNGSFNSMHVYRCAWEVLQGLKQAAEAEYVLRLAGQVIQAYLDKNDSAAARNLYLDQPDHKVLWKAYQTVQGQAGFLE